MRAVEVQVRYASKRRYEAIKMTVAGHAIITCNTMHHSHR